ncbi:Zn-ribbon domain-containing OB-fold protein [Streptomyces rapamycinicus]|uniref:DUF35 domain-containing protein n=2 Tax=Streptomyces rapamycinicus TaxID=1226757 RepID=A0A0A0NUW9_STRRN|nr:OB-fold domain-containing protein [Streptomyces rapamycinicus]AGP61401.1 hypothetical protein M271_50215 [Streptomyces rapamycinicus NRRL 5491]MBB4787419.1 putative OB-fold protein [Streptomyces rapamycinicus]RLV71762.1 hypothetical protein D3C57_144585 [Streptomyces rapamycinicus NRRL 5491]UTP36861.1 OB-fold domain-containing protein [Streptomyces rapamycinicus NRRL 5491]
MGQSVLSFRPDVFTADPPTLLASHCRDCGNKAFPPRDVCPSCGAPSGDQVPLSRRGEIYSYAVVRQAPPGLATPYVLAYIDLPEDEVRVLARVEGIAPDVVRVGTTVELGTRPVDNPDDTSVMFVFRAEEAS